MKTRKKIGIPKATTYQASKVMDLMQIINQHWDGATNQGPVHESSSIELDLFRKGTNVALC